MLQAIRYMNTCLRAQYLLPTSKGFQYPELKDETGIQESKPAKFKKRSSLKRIHFLAQFFYQQSDSNLEQLDWKDERKLCAMPFLHSRKALHGGKNAYGAA